MEDTEDHQTAGEMDGGELQVRTVTSDLLQIPDNSNQKKGGLSTLILEIMCQKILHSSPLLFKYMLP